MLKKIKNYFIKRKISKLKVTPRQIVRVAMIQSRIKAIRKSGYAAINTTTQFECLLNGQNLIDLLNLVKLQK